MKRTLFLWMSFFFLAGAVTASPGAWKQVGRAGDWKNTMAATAFGGFLYTVESTGILYKTTLTTGGWEPLGNAEFGGTIWLANDGSSLYSLEKSGSLYEIDLN